MKKAIFISLSLIFFLNGSAQSNFEKVLKGGEILVNGLSILRGNKSNLTVESNSNSNSSPKTIESICIKNKLAGKITMILKGEDEDGNTVKKELVIQKDGKECVFELPKGIYTYEIILANKETYKKGEYKFNEEMTITLKDD